MIVTKLELLEKLSELKIGSYEDTWDFLNKVEFSVADIKDDESVQVEITDTSRTFIVGESSVEKLPIKKVEIKNSVGDLLFSEGVHVID